MAKDSILVGAVNSSGAKSGDKKSSVSKTYDGVQPKPSLETRTNSPRGIPEVTFETTSKLQKPAKE